MLSQPGVQDWDATSELHNNVQLFIRVDLDL